MNFDNQGIWGVDVSFYQRLAGPPTREIDFQIMKSYGVNFVLIKVGQLDYVDPGFSYNWPHAKEAGISRGGYWFEDKDTSPQSQARKYWDLIKNDVGEGVHAMDFEDGSHNDLNSAYIFLNEFQQKSGLPNNKIAIYTGYPFWTNAINNANRDWFRRFPLWLAWYTSVPAIVKVPYPWDEVLLWQDGTPAIGNLVGVRSRDVDRDRFNGNKDKFKLYFKELNGEPMPDITFTGSVKAGKNGVIVRNNPAGTDTGFRLNEYNPIQGIGTLVTATLNGVSYQWMNIVSPYNGWVATVNLDYTPVPIPTETHKLEVFVDGILKYTEEF